MGSEFLKSSFFAYICAVLCVGKKVKRATDADVETVKDSFIWKIWYKQVVIG